VDFGNTAAERDVVLHLADHVGKEHHLPVARTRHQAKFRVAVVLDHEAGVQHLFLIAAAEAVQIGFPALPVGRIGKHEMKGCRGESIAGKGGAEADVVRLFPLAFEE